MEHWTRLIGGITVNMDTLVTMWAVMIFLIIVAFLLTRNLSIIPSKRQAIAETVVGYFVGLTESSIDSKQEAQKHVPLAASLFLFIVTANLAGQLPLRLFHLSEGELASPTNDINMTAAMAIIVLIYYVTCGLIKKKVKFFIHGFGFQEIILFLVEILELFTRPLTLALRLFGNILAGEILITALLGIAAYILPLFGMFFELLVAFVQALVFTMLTIAYVSSAVAEEH